MKLSCDFWRFLAIAFGVGLAFSIFLNIYQYFSSYPSGDFVFEWSSEEQDIVDGILRIEASFNWENESEELYITVRVNDDDYFGGDYIGLVFDKNNNWDVLDDQAYVLFANNMSYYWGKSVVFLGRYGRFDWATVPPRPSPFHTCTFNNKTGYTFKISFPKETINFHLPMRIHLTFLDLPAPKSYIHRWVWVQFEIKLTHLWKGIT